MPRLARPAFIRRAAPPRRLLTFALVCAVAGAAGAITPAGPGPIVAERVTAITRDSSWTLVASTPVGFDAHHPQGLAKVGESFFVSSVEVTVRTRRLAQPAGGLDRDAGEGRGHLFRIDAAGRLAADLRIGEGAVYHPGGIDYDGRHLWVPVAEYRPNSRSIVYRVDPRTMRATEVLRFADHLGAVVHDTDDGTLHAVSWGSRRFYRWTLDRDGRATGADVPPDRLRTPNPSHYVDYQDCQYVGARRMLCTGIAEIRAGGSAPFQLGGLDLVNLGDGRPLFQVPVALRTPAGVSMTRNAAWFEPGATGVRAYFMPEDDRSTIYTYDVRPR